MMTYWDQVAETRWGSYIIDVENAVVLRAQAWAKKPLLAIDLGCGSGRWSKLLTKLGWVATCVDVDPQALEVCQHNNPGAKCILASPTGATIPCDSGSATLLLCIEVASVIESTWFPPELSRVLEPGGLFIGVHVNRRSWRGMAVRLKYFLTRSQFRNIYYTSSYGDWRRKIAETGFEMLHEEGFCWAPFQRDSDSALIPFFTKMERCLGLPRLVGLSPWVVFIARKRAGL
jgi:SAM-dependent methyltransferase